MYSTILKDKYGLDEIQIGLCYLYVLITITQLDPPLTLPRPCGIATIISAITNGRVVDWMYRREEKRVGGDFRKKRSEFRLERTRFLGAVGFLLYVLSAIAPTLHQSSVARPVRDM